MRICLDLLPEERRDEINGKKRFFLAIKQEILFVFPVFIFIVFLICLNIVLKIQLSGLEQIYATENSQQNNRDLENYEKKFEEINDKLNIFSAVRREHIVWSETLALFSKSVPENVVLKEFSSKNYHIFTAGKSDTREILLDFKSRLESSDCFANINLPLSNLTVKNNVEFQMDFDIKKECLKLKQ